MRVLIVGHHEVAQLLPMSECIDVMERAFLALHAGDAVQPQRMAMYQPDQRGVLGLMPSYLGAPGVIGAKVITVFGGNRAVGLESHQGCIMVHETEHGRLLAIVDAGAVTGIRTAAVSGLATRLLARKDAHDLAILGSGTQAALHLAAMLAVRPIRTVRVWSRTPEHAERFAREQGQRYSLPVTAVASVQEAVAGASIICTTTMATAPILQGAWLAPGAHINAVGASVPRYRELDTEAVVRSRVYVDRLESALNEADDVRIPLWEGAITEGHILGELANLIAGTVPGRTTPDEITLFKSVGLAMEDLAAAHHVYTRAAAAAKGTWVEFSGTRE